MRPSARFGGARPIPGRRDRQRPLPLVKFFPSYWSFALRGALSGLVRRQHVAIGLRGVANVRRRRGRSVSTVLAGQRLGIKEVDESIWLVSIMSYDPGFVDQEQKTLQPLDNPFGPRLSPMS